MRCSLTASSRLGLSLAKRSTVMPSTPQAPAFDCTFAHASASVSSRATLSIRLNHGFPSNPHLSLRPVWFFLLLPTPPHGDAVTSSSQTVYGPFWASSFISQDRAASQRTRSSLRDGRLLHGITGLERPAYLRCGSTRLQQPNRSPKGKTFVRRSLPSSIGLFNGPPIRPWFQLHRFGLRLTPVRALFHQLLIQDTR